MADNLNHLVPDAIQQMQVQNQGPNDMISFQVQQGTDPHSIHLSLFWDQTDFLTGNSPLYFDNTDSIDLHITNSDQAQVDATGRWLVRQGGVFYLSDATTTFVPSNGTYSISGASLNAAQWAVWNPLSTSPSGTDMDFLGKSPTFGSLALTDVTGVGFFIEHDAFRDAYNFSVDSFSVTAQQVPEAGTWAAGISLCVLAMGVGIRRLRRN